MSPKHIKMKNFVEELKWRGMLAQIMPGTEEYLNTHLPTLCISDTFAAS